MSIYLLDYIYMLGWLIKLHSSPSSSWFGKASPFNSLFPKCLLDPCFKGFSDSYVFLGIEQPLCLHSTPTVGRGILPTLQLGNRINLNLMFLKFPQNAFFIKGWCKYFRDLAWNKKKLSMCMCFLRDSLGTTTTTNSTYNRSRSVVKESYSHYTDFDCKVIVGFMK